MTDTTSVLSIIKLCLERELSSADREFQLFRERQFHYWP